MPVRELNDERGDFAQPVRGVRSSRAESGSFAQPVRGVGNDDDAGDGAADGDDGAADDNDHATVFSLWTTQMKHLCVCVALTAASKKDWYARYQGMASDPLSKA